MERASPPRAMTRGAYPAGPTLLTLPAAGTGGFALVELVVVVAIVATVAGIAFPLYQDVTARIRVTRATADIRIIGSEIDVFNAVQGRYPADLAEIRRDAFRDPGATPIAT
jgi:prepilin-type N-terminal cleavage/methylation domain-containing protein